MRLYAQCFSHIWPVVRAEDDTLAALIEPWSERIVVAEDADLGMGHTLAAGVAQAPWPWIFIALLDMPFIEAETLRELQAAVRSAPPDARIVRPRLAHPDKTIPGHPIAFRASLRAELVRQQGDTGAKGVINRHADHLLEVLVSDQGIVRDIDRRTDLEADSA